MFTMAASQREIVLLSMKTSEMVGEIAHNVHIVYLGVREVKKEVEALNLRYIFMIPY